jgi:seryl-tRNA synthetase
MIFATRTSAMYDIKWIREHPADFDRGLQRRGLVSQTKELLQIDERRRAAITKLEQLQARRNAASKDIGEAKKKKDEAAANKLMAEVGELKNQIPQLEADATQAEEELNTILASIPNMPADDVPDGKDEKDNVEHHHFGAKRDYAFTPKQHFELGEALGQMDFETAAKLSGARFVVLKSGLAWLERALGQFMLDLHTTEHGYTEVNPPLLVRDETMFGTAQLPKFRDDQFPTKVEETIGPDEYEVSTSQTDGVIAVSFRGPRREDLKRSFLAAQGAQGDLGALGKFYMENAKVLPDGKMVGIRPVVETTRWLIPTAEVPLTNLVRESILDEEKLPLRFTACTPCFRAEAGAAGKDTRGMIRQHQFTKVELVSITTPEQSKDEHERMLSCAEEVLRRLDLHYRVVTLCAGDMGFAAQKTYDIEVWLPGQNMYREISSCSVCGEFQARRMNARYRSNAGVRPPHTLNGSGVAVGRALIAVLENYQQGDGSIAVPDVLQPYMAGMKMIGEVT